MYTQFHGTFTVQQVKQHIPFQFDVPEGTTKLDILFQYQSSEPRLNNLSLSLFDPAGFRGAGHRQAAQHHVSITSHEATPGYLPGAIPAGRWSVVVDTHMIIDSAPCTYQIDITTSSETHALTYTSPPPGKTAPRGPGWYRGDIHGHTVHSDGSWDVPDLVGYGRAYKLDFVTLTDHNTVAPLAQMDSLSGDDILTMGGMELTTYHGHALALGLRHWLDWRVRPGERTMPMIAAEVAAAGGLFVIAHPKSVGDPICTGCNWTYGDMMPGPAPAVEIWNGLWEGSSNNEDALSLWYSWLNAGYRIVATTGTDIHGPLASYERPAFNVVRSEELSEYAILRGIRAGHLYLSEGPKLNLTAVGPSGRRVMMGDELMGREAQIEMVWEGTNPGDRIRLMAGGMAMSEFAAGEHGECTLKVGADSVQWFTVEIRHEQGYMRAVSNPVFLRGL